MQTRSRVSPFLIVLFVCFLLGFLSVFARRAAQNEEASSAAVPPATTTSDQPADEEADDATVVLLLGIDGFSPENAILRSVWLMEVYANSGEVYLLGLPVDLQLAGPDTPPLRDQFSISSGSEVHPAFLDTVNLLASRAPDTIAILDEIALQEGIDFFGGVEIDGDIFTGSQIARILRLLADDPPAALKMQAQIIDALLPVAAGWNSDINISPLLALIPQHAKVSTDVVELSSLALALLPLSPEQIRIDLFLLEP